MGEHVLYCGVDPPARLPKHFRGLQLHGSASNITLNRLPISTRLVADLPDRLLDLIDIAAYVFAADRLVSRGRQDENRLGKAWRRRFRMRIAVRDPRHWSRPELVTALSDVLFVLSDDHFEFEFGQLATSPPQPDSYFLPLDDPDADTAAPILLFSGGLDSLAGSIEELMTRPGRVVLVTHRSSDLLASYQTALAREIASRFPNRVLSIPVIMTLRNGLTDGERTQRTRTFFYSVLAGVVATLMSAHVVRFYENGIMSLNLPISEQLVGTRATRSTHPRSLAEMSAFLQSALDQPMSVDNPFLMMTKAEVVRRIAHHGHSDLIDLAHTCSYVRHRPAGYSHCGICVQCLHRRFGIMAAELEAHDDSSKYAFSLFKGVPADDGKTMLVEFVRAARCWQSLSDNGFQQTYPIELARLPRPMFAAPDMRHQLFDMHRRHASQVLGVIAHGLARHKEALAEGRMPPGSLLTFVTSTQAGARQEVVELEAAVNRNLSEASEIHLMIDASGGSYAINGSPPRRGSKASALLHLLAGSHAKDTSDGKRPEDFTYLPSAQLESELGCSQEALTKLVEKLRDRLVKDAAASSNMHLQRGDVIESKPRHGYRLNPKVRLIAAPQRNINGS